MSAVAKYAQSNDASGRSFDEVMANFPPAQLALAHKTGVSESHVSDSIKLTIKEAVGLDGTSIRYGFATSSDGKKYTISDGLVKEVTAARAGAEWDEAFYAAVRAKIKAEQVKETRTATDANDARFAVTQSVLKFMPAALNPDNVKWTTYGGDRLSAKEVVDRLDASDGMNAALVKTSSKDYEHDLLATGLAKVVGSDLTGTFLVVTRAKLTEQTKQWSSKALAASKQHKAAITSVEDLANRRARAAILLKSGRQVDIDLAADIAKQSNAVRIATDAVFDTYDSMLGRKSESDYSALSKQLKQDAESWAASQGFTPGGVNGFTAAETEAHDVAHPATHRLIGLDSDGIHKAFGSLSGSTDGKVKSLIPEEALVNAVEHLAMGDTLEASIQNGLRLARVQSRAGTLAEQSYVRSPEFANKLIDLIANKAFLSDEASSVLKVVRDYAIVSGTVTASGGNFDNSATGG